VVTFRSSFNQTTEAFAFRKTTKGAPCPAGLKVAGFARLADYTVYGSDVSFRKRFPHPSTQTDAIFSHVQFDGTELATRYADGYFDNFGGPIIARALAKSGALPGGKSSHVFVQAQNANYFWHKSGTVAQVLGGLSPNRDYATYVEGGCAQFSGDVVAFDKCCE
jgi:hypothetical protein